MSAQVRDTCSVQRSRNATTRSKASGGASNRSWNSPATHRDVYRIIDEAEFVEPAAYREHYETTATRIAARLIAARDKGEIVPDLSDEDLEILAWASMGANVFLGLRYAVWSTAPMQSGSLQLRAECSRQGISA